MSDANNLLDNLFDQSGYNKLVQPNKQVIVYVGYTLQSVNSLVSMSSFSFRLPFRSLKPFLCLTIKTVNNKNKTEIDTHKDDYGYIG